MIDRRFAMQQVNRMSGLDYFSTLKPEAVEELVTAVAHADSEIIAVAAVNEWMQRSGTRPTPFDIRGVLARHNGHHAQCVKCCDTGLFTRFGFFVACECPSGDLQGAKDWAGIRILV